MRIAIHTWGSEGDVRPSLALAERLVASGHEVRLTYVAADGRSYAPGLTDVPFMHREVSTGVPREELHRIAVEVFADTSPLRQLERLLKSLLEPTFDGLAAAAREDVGWADVLVAHPFALPLCVAAEAARKPLTLLYPVVLLPTRELHPAGMPNLGPFNRLGWWLVWRLMASRLDAPLASLRTQVGLQARRSLRDQLAQSDLDLVAISPTLLPRPSDWASKAHVSGFLGAPASLHGGDLAPSLAAFRRGGGRGSRASASPFPRCPAPSSPRSRSRRPSSEH